VYERSSEDRSSEEPCSCRRARWAPTPRRPRLRSPPGLRALGEAAVDRPDDGPGTGSTAAVEPALCRPEDVPADPEVSPGVGSLERLAGDGRPSAAVRRAAAASLLSAVSPICRSPADDRGPSPASLRDRLVGTKRPLSLAIELPPLRRNDARRAERAR